MVVQQQLTPSGPAENLATAPTGGDRSQLLCWLCS